MKMKRVTRSAIISLACVGMRLAGSTDVAFLKGANVVLASTDGTSTLELKADARPKGKLRWLPGGNKLSCNSSGGQS
jgi:hypothetical protein